MTLITTRTDLIELVRRFAPTRAMERAIDEGRTTVLGAFRPQIGMPFWAGFVTTSRGRTWHFRVEVREQEQTYIVTTENVLPDFADWAGREDGRWPLLDGDMPRHMARSRAIKEAAQNGPVHLHHQPE